MVGFPGTTLTHPHRFALELIQEACSDLGSRLFLRIRERLGLAYYVGAQNFPASPPGYFAFYAGTSTENAQLVEHELLQEAALLASEGLSEDELRRAKAKILGQKKSPARTSAASPCRPPSTNSTASASISPTRKINSSKPSPPTKSASSPINTCNPPPRSFR
jgi:hypothetical protein